MARSPDLHFRLPAEAVARLDERVNALRKSAPGLCVTRNSVAKMILVQALIPATEVSHG